MIELEFEDIDDVLEDFDDDEREDMDQIAAEITYSNLIAARDVLARSVHTDELAEMILSSEIVLEDAYHGYVNFDSETDQLLDIEEHGVPGFSIREAMLNSPSVKTSLEGLRYIRIPFKGDNRNYNVLRLGNYAYQNGLDAVRGPARAIRTLSDNSPLDSWYHRGIKANPIMYQIEQNAQQSLESDMQEMFKERI